MSVMITCPECRDRYEVSDEAAEKLVRCRRCQCPIHADAQDIPADAIEVDNVPVKPAKPHPVAADDRSYDGPLHHRSPRAPFPWIAILIVVIGVMFFLLAFSVAFNVWFLTQNRRAELQAEEQRRMAELMAEKAKQQEMQANDARKKAEVELNRHLIDLEMRANEARKKAEEELNRHLKDLEKGPAAEWGTLEGRVVFKGELPKIEDFEPRIRNHVDKLHLLKSPKDQMLDPTWRIDPMTRGVANVAVYIKRPKDGVLPIHPDDKVQKDAVVFDTPFSAYVPHSAAFYPEWFDGKHRGKTGQKFILKNSSPIVDATRIVGMLPVENDFMRNIPPANEVEFDLKPQRLPVMLRSSFHPWKHAHVWVFDHPYFAITKVDGTFTIPRVPAGMEVQVMAWHEAEGWVFGRDGKTMTLKKGKNTLDFELSAK